MHEFGVAFASLTDDRVENLKQLQFCLDAALGAGANACDRSQPEAPERAYSVRTGRLADVRAG